MFYFFDIHCAKIKFGVCLSMSYATHKAYT